MLSTQNDIFKKQWTLFNVSGIISKQPQPIVNTSKFAAPDSQESLKRHHLCSKSLYHSQNVKLSFKRTQSRIQVTSGALIMAATPQGNTENFFIQMGQNLNNVIDSVGNELKYLVNQQSTYHMQLATSMSSISSMNPIHQNMMNFQQIKNSMPQNSFLLGLLNKERYTNTGGRLSTIMMAQKATAQNQKNQKKATANHQGQKQNKKKDKKSQTNTNQNSQQKQTKPIKKGTKSQPDANADHHANQLNPNNDAEKKARDHRSNQMNPNNELYYLSRGIPVYYDDDGNWWVEDDDDDDDDYYDEEED